MIDRKQLSAIETANKHPLNQAAAKFLRQTERGASPTQPHVFSLMLWGLDNGLRLRTMTEPAAWLLRLAGDPAKLTALAAGGAGGEANLTAAQLAEAETPLEAATLLLESLHSNWVAQPA